jgi:pyocin large subunit-like protein
MNSDKTKAAAKISVPLIVIGVLLCFFPAIFGHFDTDTAEKTTAARQQKTTVAAEQKQEKHYTFRTKKSLNEHFKKHGADTYCKSAEEYLEKANAVINNPNALTKNEAEDGDKVFYIEETDEIVFLSTDGYIRTYFICSGKAYFDRQ